jgi:HKD family nuclease
MTTTSISVLLDQFSGKSETFRERLFELLNHSGLERVRFAVAFARWDGIGLLSEPLERFLGRGGRFESIYGGGNRITTSDAFYYGLLLEKLFPGRTYSGFVEDKYANAMFHPKYFEFRFKSNTVVIVGSANLTGGGLQRNSEVGLEVTLPRGFVGEDGLAKYWKEIRAQARTTTQAEIERLSSLGGGQERASESNNANGKPFLASGTKAAPKPLFAKVLALPSVHKKKKEKLLGQMSELSEKPKHLYLQIMERETGGHKGKSGSAVQLPVATLGAYFGVGRAQKKVVTFAFPNETIRANIIHNSNHTHQVRLNPIFSVKRPAIIHFTRIGNDQFKARFVPGAKYAKVMAEKCTEQSRKKSRRWGLS